MSESLTGWTHKIKLIEKSSVLLNQSFTSEITEPPVLPTRAKLKVELLGQSCTGTVTVSGFDNLETHIESLNYDGPRAFITDYFYTTLVSIKPEGFDELYPPRLVISLVDDYNHEITVGVATRKCNCTFRQLSDGSRLYQTFGIVDKSLFYLRLPSRVPITPTSEFLVEGYPNTVFKVERNIRNLYLPGTKICREKETYATIVANYDVVPSGEVINNLSVGSNYDKNANGIVDVAEEAMRLRVVSGLPDPSSAMPGEIVYDIETNKIYIMRSV